jgi:hypothetical protein
MDVYDESIDILPKVWYYWTWGVARTRDVLRFAPSGAITLEGVFLSAELGLRIASHDGFHR